MRHEIKKVSKIVDEIITYFLWKWDVNVNIDIKSDENAYYISIDFNNIQLSDEEYEDIKSKLSGRRKPELEDYYWQLSGETVLSNELYFVTIMSDKISIGRKENKFYINIVRNK